MHCILTGRLAGYKRAGEDHTAILEAGPGDDGSVDPFAAKLNEKKERVAKQKKQEQRNLEEAAGKQHLPGDGNPNSKQAKAQAKAALALAQKSTASVGKFDKKLKGEKRAPIKVRCVCTRACRAASMRARKCSQAAAQLSILRAVLRHAGAHHAHARTPAHTKMRTARAHANMHARTHTRTAQGPGDFKRRRGVREEPELGTAQQNCRDRLGHV